MHHLSTPARHFALPIMLIVCAWGCPSSDNDQQARPTAETVLSGRALLHAQGEVRIYQLRTHEHLQTVKTDSSGRFQAKLGLGQGDFLLEASGGSYVEPATDFVAHADGQRLRAAIFHVNVADARSVIISPWTELLVSAAEAGGFVEYTRLATDLSALLSCGDAVYRNILEVEPQAPTDGGPHQAATSATLASLYLGGWSQLAADLSARAELQPGARITSQLLAQRLSADITDGHIDGQQAGAPLELANGFLLPADSLRQPFAQATRKFIETRHKALKTSAVVDLLGCISRNSSAMLGPPGEPLDMQPPAIVLHAPQAHAAVSGAVPLLCTAFDASPIVDAALELSRDAITFMPNVLTTQVDGLTDRSVKLTGSLASAGLEDGAFGVSCRAIDRWGNEAIKHSEATINNHGGQVRIAVSPLGDNNTVAGVVEVTCACEDEFAQGCTLAEPLPQGMSVVSTEVRKSHYLWNTPAQMDGSYVLACQDFSQGLTKPTVAALAVDIDNVNPGVAEGWIALDGPVKNVTIAAYAYENASRGKLLQQTIGVDGQFRMALPDNYRGPILFEAASAQSIQARAHFSSAVLEDTLALGEGRLTLLYEMYEPGEVLTGLSLNVLTSLAEAYASALFETQPTWLDDQSLGGASRLAHILWAQHLRPEKPFDVRFTPVANLTTLASTLEEHAAHEQTFNGLLLALFNVGLSRLSAEASLEEYGMAHAVTITHVLDLLRQDLRDLSLDGLDASNPDSPAQQLYITPGHPLGPQFLRYELAAAIRRWLNAESLTNLLPGSNKTPLTAAQFSKPRQLLRNMAANASKLFGERAGGEFDQEGPTLHVRVEDQARREVDLRRPQNGPLHFIITATDDSGVASISAVVNDRTLPSQGVPTAERAEFILDPAAGFPDGTFVVQCAAIDRVGNASSPYTLEIQIDTVAPKVQPDRTVLWSQNGTFSLDGSVSKASAFVTITSAGAGTLSTARDVAAGRFRITGQTACNQAYQLQVVATDYAGNTSSTPIALRCDAQAPRMQVLDTSYRHDRVVSVMTAGDATWRSVPTFRKFFDALDYLPPHINRDTGNLPALRFAVHDIVDASTPGTPPEELRVSYRYVYEGHLGHQERDWQPLNELASDATQQGRIGPAEYQVLVAYQTLLPQSLLAQGLLHAQIGNFIARAKPEDLHHLHIRVEDLAGNQRDYDFPFRLEIWSQALKLSQCEPVSLDYANLARGTLAAFYQQGAPISTARISWPITRPAMTLMPRGGRLHITLAGAIDSRIRKLGTMLYAISERRRGPTADCKPQNYNHHIVWDDGVCQHAGSDHWNHYPRHWDWSFDHQTTQPLTPQSFTSAGQEAPHGSPASFFADGTREYMAQLSNAGPFRHANGNAFDWVTVPHQDGGPVYAWSYREGEEGHYSFMNPEKQRIAQREYLQEVEAIFRPVEITLLGIDDVPHPVSVERDASCSTPLSVTWTRDNQTPVIRRF